YKQAAIHSKFFTKTTDGIASDILRAENEHLLKKLVQYNFASPPTCYLEAEPLSDDKREFILELCRDILASNADRRTVEACRDKIAQMGLTMPEEAPASPPPTAAPAAVEEEPMPKGEGDVAALEAGISFGAQKAGARWLPTKEVLAFLRRRPWPYPSTAEIAVALGLHVDDVLEALEMLEGQGKVERVKRRGHFAWHVTEI
ncbi:MAG: hypothetical protein JSU81_03270, partial [Candidatus Coatesbacteria bacterium]